MALEALGQYRSLVVDYSIIREYAGTALFGEFLDLIVSSSADIYVSKSFKLLHYCVIHQADTKNASASNAMRDFCSLLLPGRKLHSVQTTETTEFMAGIAELPDCCIVTTATGIFTKRLLEKKPGFKCDLAMLEAGKVTIYHGLDDLLSNYELQKISPLASVNKYLEASAFCNVGDTVTTGEQKPIVLTKRISSGAEGMVFATDNPKLVAKLYHRGVTTPLRWSKLTNMVSMGIKSVGICWPQDLLFYKGIPVGYTMILGKGKTLGNIFDGPDAIVNAFPKWKRIDVVTTLADLLEKYIYLHMHNIIAGDIQLKNALIFSANSLYLIDMDSCQVGNLPCPVGTEEFTPPSLWGKNFSGFLRKLEDEDYCIAMLVFSILFCGLHPYATRNGKETLREEILERNFPYDLENASVEHIPRGGYDHIWEYLPDDIRKMLYDTFKNGKTYEAVEWYEAVLDYKEKLSTKAFEDEEAYKVFPKMEYHATVTEPAPAADAPTGKSFYKSRFQGLNDPNVFNPNSSNPFAASNANNTPAPGIFSSNGNYSGSASPFVPLGDTAAKKTAPAPEPVQDEPSGDNSGIFKKFRKGLFGQ